MTNLTINTVNLRKDSCKQILKGVVYKPYEVDSQGDWMSPETIEEMAYSFMKKSAMSNVDTNHDFELVPAYICESYIAQNNDPDGYLEGSWVVAIKVEDAEIWAGVEDGTYAGISLAGKAKCVEEAAPPT